MERQNKLHNCVRDPAPHRNLLEVEQDVLSLLYCPLECPVWEGPPIRLDGEQVLQWHFARVVLVPISTNLDILPDLILTS